jgi:HprK-related kinase A
VVTAKPLHASVFPKRWGAVDAADAQRALCANGVWLDIGSAVIHLRSDSPELAMQVQTLYAAFPFVDDGVWADVHLQMDRSLGWRRWWRPQVLLRCDGSFPFEPFPADGPFPFFEWSCNWMIGRRLNDLLLLHAGVVERDGLALVMPALPGSGKSTLTAALSLRGWRLLSDEFGAFDPELGSFRAMLKPVGLKNQSIDVIRRFAPEAAIGPSFPKTHKGVVAHLAPDLLAVDQRHVPARPGAVVLPKWQAGAVTHLEPWPAHLAFSALAFNAFNYTLLGQVGFDAVVSLTQQCPTWNLVYSDLNDALAALDALWPSIRAHHDLAPA